MPLAALEDDAGSWRRCWSPLPSAPVRTHHWTPRRQHRPAGPDAGHPVPGLRHRRQGALRLPAHLGARRPGRTLERAAAEEPGLLDLPGRCRRLIGGSIVEAHQNPTASGTSSWRSFEQLDTTWLPAIGCALGLFAPFRSTSWPEIRIVCPCPVVRRRKPWLKPSFDSA